MEKIKSELDVTALTIDDQLKELKMQKANQGKLFDIEISRLELKQNAIKTGQNEIAYNEKEDKIREKLVRSLMSDKSGKIPGQSVDQLIPVEPQAQGHPTIPVG